MADRFPSIEDIDAGDSTLGGESADTGDFLARERAALGTDADLFTTPHDVPSVSVQDGADDDLLGGGDGLDGTSDETNQFQRNFPAVDTRNERMAPGGTITGSASPFLPGARSTAGPGSRPYSPAPSFQPPAEEPEVIKHWREGRDAAIAKREEASAARKESTTKEAQQAIDEFYENYNQKRDKGVAQTRKEADEFMEKREDTTAGGTSWERIAKLVDLKKAGAGSGGVSGRDRFREMLGTLAKDENAPGAKGY